MHHFLPHIKSSNTIKQNGHVMFLINLQMSGIFALWVIQHHASQICSLSCDYASCLTTHIVIQRQNVCKAEHCIHEWMVDSKNCKQQQINKQTDIKLSHLTTSDTRYIVVLQQNVSCVALVNFQRIQRFPHKLLRTLYVLSPRSRMFARLNTTYAWLVDFQDGSLIVWLLDHLIFATDHHQNNQKAEKTAYYISDTSGCSIRCMERCWWIVGMFSNRSSRKRSHSVYLYRTCMLSTIDRDRPQHCSFSTQITLMR